MVPWAGVNLWAHLFMSSGARCSWHFMSRGEPVSPSFHEQWCEMLMAFHEQGWTCEPIFSWAVVQDAHGVSWAGVNLWAHLFMSSGAKCSWCFMSRGERVSPSFHLIPLFMRNLTWGTYTVQCRWADSRRSVVPIIYYFFEMFKILYYFVYYTSRFISGRTNLKHGKLHQHFFVIALWISRTTLWSVEVLMILNAWELIIFVFNLELISFDFRVEVSLPCGLLFGCISCTWWCSDKRITGAGAKLRGGRMVRLFLIFSGPECGLKN